MTNLIDLRETRAAADDLPGLQGCLAQLVGEPFRHARVSYGDELTLHFGDLRPAKSPKLAGKAYGAYVFGARASRWVLKSGSAPLVQIADRDGDAGQPTRKEDLEANPLIAPDARVTSARAFAVGLADALGVELRFTDGSSLRVLPELPEAERPADADLPVLADWELASPAGLLSAGPGRRWSFQPTGRIDDSA